MACGGGVPEHDPDIETPHTEIPPPSTLNFRIMGQFPHDTGAYTQGLEFHKGRLWEGTGDFEQSSLRLTDPKTGQVLKKHQMGSADIFGEGITILNDTLYQLTWESHKVFVYRLPDIGKPVKTLDWPHDGWGITHDSSRLIISDGSATLYFVRPDDLRVLSTLSVRDNTGPVDRLNELEFVKGQIFANVYTTNRIVRIDPQSGQVTGQLMLNGLLGSSDIIAGRTDVLNGIAYEPDSNRLWITGKRWPRMFSLQLD